MDRPTSESAQTVLVVDDDPPRRRALARDLRVIGYNAVIGSTPSTALAMMRFRFFEAVVCAGHLTVGGRSLARETRRASSSTPVVVLADHGSELAGFITLSLKHSREQLDATLTMAIENRATGEFFAVTGASKMAEQVVRVLHEDGESHGGDAERLGAWARMLGKACGLTGEELMQCELGARIHDVGVIGVSHSVRAKQGLLDDHEWDEIRRHPSFGREMLAGIPSLLIASDVVYCHHERWDGSGYPRGLSGEEIPRAARVFAVVDSYDAMTRDRPFRQAMPHSQAREEIASQAGAMYDPRVVEAFLAIDEAEWLAARDGGQAQPQADEALSA